MGLKAKDTRTTQILFDVRRTLVCAPSYFSQRSRITEPNELDGWDWLLPSPVHLRGIRFERAKRRPVKLKPTGRIHSNDAQSLYHIARAGARVVAVPEFLAAKDISTGTMIHVLPDWKLSDVKVFAEC